MEDFGADLLRGSVSSIMNAVLLFVFSKPKYSKKVIVSVITGIFLVEIMTSVYFYSINDLTSLARFDVFLFLSFVIILKPFVKQGIFPWVFNNLTVMNLFVVIVFISYHLADFFPYPYYSNTMIRLVLYCLIIRLFLKYVSPFYHQVMENWKIYFFLVLSMFLNFVYYIISADDIEQMLSDQFVPIILLILMCSLIYITIFYFQQKSIANYILREEQQHYKMLAYMDTLTGVLNRNGYESYIENKLKTNYDSFCIGIYDINNLKVVNDSFGHEAGDKLISDASRIISKAFRSSTIFRIGGDEFVSVSINVAEGEIETQYHEMLCLLAEYNNVSNTNIAMDIAFGYAIDNYPVSVDELFAKADSNMYANKIKIKKGK